MASILERCAYVKLLTSILVVSNFAKDVDISVAIHTYFYCTYSILLTAQHEFDTQDNGWDYQILIRVYKIILPNFLIFLNIYIFLNIS